MKWPYNTAAWRRLRLDALIMHGAKCADCGKTDGRLDVHHARPLTEQDRVTKDVKRGFPDPAELVILCNSCHALITRGVTKPERIRRRAWRAFLQSQGVRSETVRQVEDQFIKVT